MIDEQIMWTYKYSTFQWKKQQQTNTKNMLSNVYSSNWVPEEKKKKKNSIKILT